jgi:radical SAM protein with 4Fe4S-binding SPASM domain
VLQRISVEIERRCNLGCIYCYADAATDHSPGLSDDALREIVDQAVDLGAVLVSIVGGGEPLLRRSLLADRASLIDHANGRGCYCLLYTNGTMLDPSRAAWLARRDVSVIGKLNSLDAARQDRLAGVAGSAARIMRGIEILLDAGLARSTPSRLGLETIICRDNYEEMPTLWRWMRSRGIVPEVEIPTLHGRAAARRAELCFDEQEAPEKYRALFEELLAIDRAEFGFDWQPHPPFVAQSCRLYYDNCYVNDRGGVQPCAGVEQELGRLSFAEPRAADGTLAAILRGERFEAMRHIHERLEPPCGGCELAEQCYGCRGAAYTQSGNLYGADPVCWHGCREPGCLGSAVGARRPGPDSR